MERRKERREGERRGLGWEKENLVVLELAYFVVIKISSLTVVIPAES